MELYYQLRLVFESDFEYILDVALTSTLDEFCTSKDTVGFRLFSLILEDRHAFSNTNRDLLKYLTICGILMDSCADGPRKVEKFGYFNHPIEPDFKDYLKTVLVGTSEGFEKRLKTYKDVCKNVKPNLVKCQARGRLVVVSERHLNGSQGGSSDSSSNFEDGGVDEIENGNVELPSTSFRQVDEQMDDLLGQLGLGDDAFYLDRSGEGEENYESCEESVDHHQVSSSSQTRRNGDVLLNDEEYVSSSPGKKTPALNNFYSPREPDSDEEVEAFHHHKEQNMEEDQETVQDQEEKENSSDSDGMEVPPEKDAKPAEEDSDLEVIAEVVTTPQRDNASDGSEASRDEAEPESGEDEVPNYDVDSDEEQREKSPPSEPAATNTQVQSAITTEVNSEEVVQENGNDKVSADYNSDSDATQRLSGSPYKKAIKSKSTTETSSALDVDDTESIPAPEGSELSLPSIGPHDSPKSSPGKSPKSTPVKDSKSPVKTPNASPVKSTRSSGSPVKTPPKTSTPESESEEEETPSKRAKLEAQTSEPAKSPDSEENVKSPVKTPPRSANTARRGRPTRASTRTPAKSQSVDSQSPVRRSTRSCAVSQSTPAPSQTEDPDVSDSSETPASQSSVRGEFRARRGRRGQAPVRSSQRLK